jgi:hypothetical protein
MVRVLLSSRVFFSWIPDLHDNLNACSIIRAACTSAFALRLSLKHLTNAGIRAPPKVPAATASPIRRHFGMALSLHCELLKQVAVPL